MGNVPEPLRALNPQNKMNYIHLRKQGADESGNTQQPFPLSLPAEIYNSLVQMWMQLSCCLTNWPQGQLRPSHDFSITHRDGRGSGRHS